VFQLWHYNSGIVENVCLCSCLSSLPDSKSSLSAVSLFFALRQCIAGSCLLWGCCIWAEAPAQGIQAAEAMLYQVSAAFNAAHS
jgi:hypothetical protein